MMLGGKGQHTRLLCFLFVRLSIIFCGFLGSILFLFDFHVLFSSSFQLKMTMDGGETKTEFTLEISVFKDENYLLPFGIRDFPLKVSLGKPLFVQVGW